MNKALAAEHTPIVAHAARTSVIVSGLSPRIATNTAMPTAVPNCSAARVEALATENRAAPTSRTPDDCSIGNAMLIPRPYITAPGNQSTQ